MLKVRILTVGRVKEDYLKMGVEQFRRRLQPYCRLEEVEVDPAASLPQRPRPEDIDKAIKQEEEKLLQAMNPSFYNIVLDERGKVVTSRGLARSLSNLQNKGHSRVAFIIGGPFGLGEGVKEKGDYMLSFSRLTFTHEMIRLVLMEQIYRALKIMSSEPYHY